MQRNKDTENKQKDFLKKSYAFKTYLQQKKYKSNKKIIKVAFYF